jgi:hypothetical protein
MEKAQILPFINNFINNFIAALSESLRSTNPSFRLTKCQCQCLWLSFCLAGILLPNKICWSSFHRNSFGGWGVSALSWMFR